MGVVRNDVYAVLTALLSPSHSLCLNRAVPKFMKRIKVPDYKDRNVFGVPLPINVQRTGQPLPQSIQQAMRYLRSHCLDQVSFTSLPFHYAVTNPARD